jgi:hypothetical protein
LNTKRTKRWNGQIDTLAADYLKDVMGQMVTYGDRVQFGLSGSGQRPNYQVINAADKKMAFDSNNHLLHPQEHEFDGPNATRVFTLDQVKAAIVGGGRTASAATRVSRAGSTGRTRGTTAAVKVKDVIDTEKYEYFKNNRQTLPASIGEYSAVITELMKKGMSAEQAFGEIVKQHF